MSPPPSLSGRILNSSTGSATPPPPTPSAPISAEDEAARTCASIPSAPSHDRHHPPGEHRRTAPEPHSSQYQHGRRRLRQPGRHPPGTSSGTRDGSTIKVGALRARPRLRRGQARRVAQRSELVPELRVARCSGGAAVVQRRHPRLRRGHQRAGPRRPRRPRGVGRPTGALDRIEGHPRRDEVITSWVTSDWYSDDPLQRTCRAPGPRPIRHLVVRRHPRQLRCRDRHAQRSATSWSPPRRSGRRGKGARLRARRRHASNLGFGDGLFGETSSVDKETAR